MELRNYNLIKRSIFIGFYVLLLIITFIEVVEPSLQGNTELRVGADSLTYIQAAKWVDKSENLVSVSNNLFGPVLILWIFENNFFAVVIFNSILLILALLFLSKDFPHIDKILFLILLNPILFFSLLTPNKEIFSFLGISLFACFLKNNNKKILFMSLIASTFARWHQAIFLLLFLLWNSQFNPLYKRRLLSLIALVFIISILYPYLFNQLTFLDSNIEASIDNEFAQSITGGTTLYLNNLQNNFLFFAALIPKIFITYFGIIWKNIPQMIFDIELINNDDLYNNYIMLGHQIYTIIILPILINKHRLSLNSDNVYLAIFLTILFSATPFIQIRYIFPVYLLLCLELSKINYGRAIS